jgi:hypothetical protein
MTKLVSTVLVVLGMACGSKQTPAQQNCEPGRCLADIAAVISKEKPSARACYEKGLARAPEIRGGRVMINFEIDPSGTPDKVEQAARDDQIKDPEVITCLSAIIYGVTFPKSTKGKTVRAYHVFEFSPRPH